MHLFLRKLYYAVWKRIYTNDTVCLFEMTAPANVHPVVVKEVTAHNLRDAGAFQSERQLTRFQEFLKKGDRGFYGYLDNRCVHRSWVVPSPGPASIHPLYQLPLAANEVFVHFSETAAWARGKNIFTGVLSYIGEEFRGKRIMISAARSNNSSIKSIKKSGFSEITTFHILIILGIRVVSSKPTNA